MKIKSTTAFRAYAAARQRRAAATKSFMVKSVNKDGSISRMLPTRNDWQSHAFATAEQADAHRAKLEVLNPGRRFPVVAV